MKTLFLITVALACLSTPLIHTQEGELKAKTKTFKNHRRFEVKYDKFEDSTNVSVGPFLVKDRRNSRIVGVSASATFKGQAPGSSESVYLHFRGNPYALTDASLFAIVDGERLDLGRGDRLSSGIYSGSASMMFTLPLELFRKLASAKEVELKAGNAELKLEAEHFQAFQDFLSLVETKGTN